MSDFFENADNGIPLKSLFSDSHVVKDKEKKPSASSISYQKGPKAPVDHNITPNMVTHFLPRTGFPVDMMTAVMTIVPLRTGASTNGQPVDLNKLGKTLKPGISPKTELVI